MVCLIYQVIFFTRYHTVICVVLFACLYLFLQCSPCVLYTFQYVVWLCLSSVSLTWLSVPSLCNALLILYYTLRFVFTCVRFSLLPLWSLSVFSPFFFFHFPSHVYLYVLLSLYIWLLLYLLPQSSLICFLRAFSRFSRVVIVVVSLTNFCLCPGISFSWFSLMVSICFLM